MATKDGKLDSVVREIVERFRVRAALGKEKYGTDLDRQDLDLLDWIAHAREEAMDLVLYLTKIERELRKKQAKE